MAPVAVAERSQEHDKVQIPDFSYANSDDGRSEDSDTDMEKDATEEELERLVFGDRTGFLEGLRQFGKGGELVGTAREDESEDDDGSELENVADADVC